MRSRHRALVLVAVLLAACGGTEDEGPPAREPTPLDRSTTGTITGTVTFAGTPPAPTVLNLGSEPACAGLHTGEVTAGDVLVHDGKVENAFVWVKEGLGDRVFAVPETPATIDQRGCMYVPHVLGVQVGQAIRFLNSDQLLHNVHGTPEASPPWNFAMGARAAPRTIRLARPEVMVHIRCDVHPWMHAFVGVVDHPYFAVTGAGGRFTFADVPPGSYVVASWHERFGTRETRVELGPRETKDVAFTYGAP